VDEIYRLATAIVGQTDAWDLTQETFVVAWQQLPRLREPKSFRTWLRRICVNRCRNWLRHARRHRPFSSGEGELLEVGASVSQPDFRDASESRVDLEQAFAGLRADQRILLALHYSMCYSIAETARLMGIRQGTAKSRLSAGLSALRQAIAKPEQATSQEAME